MAELSHGQVVLYSYLWWREHERGEETGRKARPSCVMILVPAGGEARRAKLYTPAWVIVEEFNSDSPTNSLALEAARPLGVFSRKFVGSIAAAAAAAARARGARVVNRT